MRIWSSNKTYNLWLSQKFLSNQKELLNRNENFWEKNVSEGRWRRKKRNKCYKAYNIWIYEQWGQKKSETARAENVYFRRSKGNITTICLSRPNYFTIWVVSISCTFGWSFFLPLPTSAQKIVFSRENSLQVAKLKSSIKQFLASSNSKLLRCPKDQ